MSNPTIAALLALPLVAYLMWAYPAVIRMALRGNGQQTPPVVTPAEDIDPACAEDTYRGTWTLGAEHDTSAYPANL